MDFGIFGIRRGNTRTERLSLYYLGQRPGERRGAAGYYLLRRSLQGLDTVSTVFPRMIASLD